MEWTPVPAEEIFERATEIADRTQDFHLIDCITVTRGYSELLQMNPSNEVYQVKLRLALKALAEASRGLEPSAQTRIAMLGGLTLTWSLN